MRAARILVRVVLSLLWFGVCTHLLVVGLTALNDSSNPETVQGTFVFYQGIRVVGFPLGFVAWYLVYGSLALMEVRPSPEIQMWVMWAAVAAVGYVQWFYLVPWLFRQMVQSRKGLQTG